MTDSSRQTDGFMAQLVELIAEAVAEKLGQHFSKPEVGDELLDEPTMAEQLGVSQQTLQRRRAAGEVPFVRLGRRVLYRPADVFAALSEKQDGGKQ